MLAHTCAIVLAAGLSSRMGSAKALLPLGDTTVLGRVLRLFAQAGVGHTLVVLGHRAPDLLPEVLAGRAQPVLNERYLEGMFSSIQAGVASLPHDCRSFFLLPTDIPLVRVSTLEVLAGVMEVDDPLVAIPTHAGRRGHPPLLAASLSPSILTWDAPGGLRALLARHGDRLIEAPVSDPGILMDMDDPEQYRAVQEALRAGAQGD